MTHEINEDMYKNDNSCSVQYFLTTWLYLATEASSNNILKLFSSYLVVVNRRKINLVSQFFVFLFCRDEVKFFFQDNIKIQLEQLMVSQIVNNCRNVWQTIKGVCQNVWYDGI